MPDINDDLLPGDEDEILADLAKNDRTAIAAEAIKKQISAIMDAGIMSRLQGLDFASGGIFNRDTTMPFVPMSDEAVTPKRWLTNIGMKVMHPKRAALITNVGC